MFISMLFTCLNGIANVFFSTNHLQTPNLFLLLRITSLGVNCVKVVCWLSLFFSLLDPHFQEVWLHKVQRHRLWWHAGREASDPRRLWGEIHPQPWTLEPLEGPARQLSTTHVIASVWTKALLTTNKVHSLIYSPFVGFFSGLHLNILVKYILV